MRRNNDFTPREFEANHKIQKMFADSQISAVSLFDVEFFDIDTMIALGRQQFFLYQGKWRATDRKSEFGLIIFEETKIRAVAFWSQSYYVK